MQNTAQPTTRKSNESNSIRRAALVLVSLNDAEAAELMRRMSPTEVAAVSKVIESLEQIDPAEQAEALREFQQRLGRVAQRPAFHEKPSAELLPGDQPGAWPAEAIRLSFDPHQAEDWALALADCDQATVDWVMNALGRSDRKLVAHADRNRGPWRLDEPHKARQRIKSRPI